MNDEQLHICLKRGILLPRYRLKEQHKLLNMYTCSNKRPEAMSTLMVTLQKHPYYKIIKVGGTLNSGHFIIANAITFRSRQQHCKR